MQFMCAMGGEQPRTQNQTARVARYLPSPPRWQLGRALSRGT